MSNPLNPQPEIYDAEAEKLMKRLSRRGFLWGALYVAFGYGTLHWLDTRHQIDGLNWPFRRVLDFNQSLSTDYLSNNHRATEHPLSQTEDVEDNGDEGLSDGFDPEKWMLSVVGTNSDDPVMVSLSDIQKIGKVDMVTELRCIEGWERVIHWTGCRLRDFLLKYPPADVQDNLKPDPDNLDSLPNFIGMETPDGGYYVGLDMKSAMHPQTLLCWAMNGKPLALEHGAPLRLVIPTKYGVKNIKRIGTITYQNHQPKDYWAEQGYDWFAGL